MRKFDYLILIILNISTFIVAYPILTFPLGRDQGEFATIASMMITGRPLYADAWNPKPPAIFIVYKWAIELFGISSTSVRLIDFIIFPLISFSLYWIAIQIANRRVAILSVVIYVSLYFTESFWTLSQNDGVAILPIILMFCCGMMSLMNDNYHYLWALSAGILGGILIWFKYPFAMIISISLLASIPYHLNRKQLLKNAIAFGFGGLVTLFIGYYLLLEANAWHVFIESAKVTSQYARRSYDIDFILYDVTWQQARRDRWLQWRIPALIVLFGAVTKYMSNHNTKPITTERSKWWLILAWLFGSFFAMFVQAKGYDYHWLPMLPALVLFTAYFADLLLAFVSKWLIRTEYQVDQLINFFTVGISILLLISTAVSLWLPAWDFISGKENKLSYYQNFRGGEFVADESQEIIEYLDERTIDDDTLYIWGFRAEVYYLTKLRPATRFIFQFPLVAEWYPQEWREENVNVLWAALPPYVLIMQGDYMPWVTDRNEDSNQLLQEYSALNDWLIFNYDYDTTIGNFIVWKRKE